MQAEISFAWAHVRPGTSFRHRLKERNVDRKSAEALAERAIHIATGVLGDDRQALDAVTRAAERVRTERPQSNIYHVQFLRAVIAETRAVAQGALEKRGEVVSDSARRAALALNLQRLPIEDRILVALCSIGGLSYTEAAQVTSVSKHEILMRLASARRQLWEVGN